MTSTEIDYNQDFDLGTVLKIEQQRTSCLADLSKGIDLLKVIQRIRKEDPNTKLVFSYTSNIVSSGHREVIRYMCQHKLVDCVVTSCGGIEEDFIKCQNHFYKGKFFNNDYLLRMNGINRTGNMYVPNKNYVDFEDFLNPIISKMAK
jgi:deoxyhypusine synthase